MDQPELAEVLRLVIARVADPSTDVAWTSYPSAAGLRAVLDEHLARVEGRDGLGDEERRELRLLFAPTGALQETSASSGWGEEFVALAARFDVAIGDG